jgi:AcrR family transcriptional regulator
MSELLNPGDVAITECFFHSNVQIRLNVILINTQILLNKNRRIDSMKDDRNGVSKRQALQPRKKPSQQRSQFTVDSILQAALELIRSEGFDNLGTAKIAERAGVLIGSVYHYFPNYESILLGLYENVASKAWQKMKLAISSNIDLGIDPASRKEIMLLLNLYEEHRLILIEMVAKVPAIEQATASVSFESLLRGTIRTYLQQHPKHRAKDLTRQLFFIEIIVLDGVRRYVLNPPLNMSKARFVSEVSTILSDYLKKDLGERGAGEFSK